jgi:DNA/RNA-binding protein KIN17
MGGDGGVLTAKAIGKRIKAKGLGRLRWYCQMCGKQCRDENGFKCHTNTPAHQSQLALFAEKPELFVEKFSDAFLQDFMSILHQRYGSNAVSANNVYQEYIKDRNHIHMNSTRWTTLTEFVKDLGRTGRCRVEDREGTLWVAYVDREVIERRRRADAIQRARLDEEELAERRMERKMQTMQNSIPDPKPSQDTRQIQGHDAELNEIEIVLSMASKSRPRRGRFSEVPNDDSFKDLESTRITSEGTESASHKRTDASASRRVLDDIVADIKRREKFPVLAVEAIAQPESSSKAKCEGVLTSEWTCDANNAMNRLPSRERTRNESSQHSWPNSCDTRVPGQRSVLKRKRPSNSWLRIGIVVKMLSEELRGGALFGKKGVVVSLRDEYTANIRMLNSNALLQVDRDDLRTVIPKPGGLVMFLRGQYAGDVGIVENIDEGSYSISVELRRTGERVDAIDYEDVSKVSADLFGPIPAVG